MRIFQNDHRHSSLSNITLPDSVVTNEDYAIRASELGHGIISTMEHKWQGRYIEGYELAKKYDLKFVFGVEAYWVKDRFEKDNTNAHICIFAKTENARQCINDILSEANISGFYYRPRLDLDLIFSLPADEVIITTACVACWKYNDDDIILSMHKYFKDNFYLEVQYHHTESQKELNKHILELSEKHEISLIMGCDSHYITEDTAWERDEYIKSKGINYDDEEGWFLDYPDGDTAYNRFVKQGVLNETQINEAMNNTNIFLTVEKYDNPCFTKEIKMPTLYPDLTQEEKDEKYVNLIWSQWDKEKQKIPEDKYEHYMQEIQKEVDAIIETKHSDYLLIDYELVKESVKRGGMLTPTGRGSMIGFYTTKLLGLTKVDRISAEIKMYPERFISTTRIIQSKSLADLDLNWGNPEVPIQVQKDLLGENCVSPMISFGTMRAKSAWNMYAKAKEINFELAQKVSEQIEKYEKALKYANEEDIDDIDLFDFVDEEYHEVLTDSKKYLGLISDAKPHNCGFLLYQGNIRREIGLIKTKSKTGKKEFLCTIMDGKWAEDYKFMKNDLLKVAVVKVIYKTYERIGQPIPDVKELIEKTKNEEKTWDIYKKGYVIGVNQVERRGTKHRVMQYKPQNISELCAFIAAIRPGFKSMYKIFSNRENFTYNIPTFDNLIQTPEMQSSFVLYQEMSMAALNFAGIPMSECYDIIKNIAKKREEKVKAYREEFLKGFTEKVMILENKTQEESNEIANKVWQIISDSSLYSFNSAHSYCVSNDSLYIAYLKSHYPLEFYETFLRILDEGKEKDRMKDTQKEAEKAFGIRFMPFRFRQDNQNIVADPKTNTITNTLKSIKGFGAKLGEQLYSLRDNTYEGFIDLLIDMEEKGILCAKIEDLIKIQYFDEFGNNGKLLSLYNEFTGGDNRYDKKHKDNTKEKRIDALKFLEAILPNDRILIKDQMSFENDILGYIQTTCDISDKYVHVLNIDLKYSPKADLYCLKTSNSATMKIRKIIYKKNPFKKNDIIYIKEFEIKPQMQKVGDDFISIADTKEYWIKDYKIINNIDSMLTTQNNA